MIKNKVAICIPSYNNVDGLKKLLDSIAQQTYKDFFVVISDDSSDNKIETLVNSYKKYNFSIVYRKNTVPLGPTANTNNAINIADKYNYMYLKIMHHDDFFTFENSLDNFVQMLDDNPNVSMAFSGCVQLSNDNTYERCISENDLNQLEEDYRVLVLGNYIGNPSATIMRKTYIQMDEVLKWHVDCEWYLRILNRNSSFYCSRRPLVSIYLGTDNVTNYCLQNKELMLRELIYVYKKNTFLHYERYTTEIIDRLYSYVIDNEMKKFASDSFVFIYGAGFYGRQCAIYLKSIGIKFEGFVVTHKKESLIDGIKVFSLDEIQKNNNKMQVKFFIAARKKIVSEIENILIKNNFYVQSNIKIFNSASGVWGKNFYVQ